MFSPKHYNIYNNIWDIFHFKLQTWKGFKLTYLVWLKKINNFMFLG